jgi:hypothetical protein
VDIVLQNAIATAWARLCERVEVTRDLTFDHEFTLQFHLAWEVARRLDFSDKLGVRFEVPCGRDDDGETIRLDLLLWQNPHDKVAVELKAPLRSHTGKNSAMTQFRMRFYRDIHRLNYLVKSGHDGVTSGCFLAVANELGYVEERKKRMNLVYRTYHGTVLAGGSTVAPTPGPNGYGFHLNMPPHEIRWDWQCEKAVGGWVVPIAGRRHFWLNPIVVTSSSGL